MAVVNTEKRGASLYDEESLEKQLRQQKKHAWDLEKDIDWSTGIDLNRPLVPLDDKACFFPGSSKEEKLVISHMMGLVITMSICELEESLERLENECWAKVISRHPVSPEFNELGEQFFVEEVKHSRAFRRYLNYFANSAGVDLEDLKRILPKVEESATEKFVRKNLDNRGHVFWWMVSVIEQQFLWLYKIMVPFKHDLEPLFYTLQKRHFEEEARHINFPHLMLELMMERDNTTLGKLHSKIDLAVAEVAMTQMVANGLARMRNVKKLKEKHELFAIMTKVLPKMMDQPKHQLVWQFFTSVPYISSLVNPRYHDKFLKFAKDSGVVSIPFPKPKPEILRAF
ncbi:MAG: diiron oxygenase [Bacteriovoracia bacterium]